MTRGGLVTSNTRANTEWIFDTHTANVIKNNLGKAPCRTTADYDEEFLKSVYYDHPDFLNDLDEVGNFDARLSFSGLLASDFDIGWYGEDSDNGLIDGSSEFDFIYKTSLEGNPDEDAALLTFFEDAHSTVQFVLCGQEGTLYEGLWFAMNYDDITPSDFITTPDGEDIFRSVHIGWDIDSTPGYDVEITLNSYETHTPYGAVYNGWQISAIPEPSSLILFGFGLLGLLVVKKKSRYV